MLFLAAALLAFSCSDPTWIHATWIDQTDHTTSGLRGLHAVSQSVAWASGTSGTYLRTVDGGKHWTAAQVAGAETLDFRDVEAFDGQTAYLLSSGPGDQSRIYKTTNGGERWELLFTNPDPKGFLDAIAFWDRQNGILMGDPVDGRFAIFTTSDGGRQWTRQNAPAALPGEGAFAASGTCLIAFGKSQAWFGTGGPGGGRVFHTTDRGKTWTVSTTPLSGSAGSSGIYSLAFRDKLHGIAVGGDYQKPNESKNTVALTDDGGRTWRTPKHDLGGYRSAVAFLLPNSRALIAVGSSGSDFSNDGGESWHAFSSTALNAVVSVNGQTWAAGPKGRLVKLAVSSGLR
ncbi:MAG: hypothetical protein JOY54_01935 [Acidobacteriaceae bacterium]|nr:hypothetical protein [Acidobacteriaceae bacterium]